MTLDPATEKASAGEAAQRQPSLPPYFDHAFVTVSADTVKLINDCEFLHGEKLGRYAIRASTSSLLGSYMPTRVFGRTNLVEIFPHRFGGNDAFIEHLGGIVLTFGSPAEMVRGQELLRSAGIEFSSERVERITPDANGGPDQILRYRFTRPMMGADCPIAVFLHAIEPNVATEPSATPTPSAGRPDRSTRFDASLGRPHTPDQIMEDIGGVTVWLGPDRVLRAAALLESLGCETTTSETGVRVSGVDAELDFRADGTRPEGTVELKIKLSKPCPGRRYEFGPHSSLVLSPLGPGDLSASWIFLPHR